MTKLALDIDFLTKKCDYHKSRFLMEYSNFILSQKEVSKKSAAAKMKNENIRFDGTEEYIMTIRHESYLSHPLIYEFDSFMIDCKRTIEFICNLINAYYGLPPPKKGVESFFNSLNPKFVGNKREIGKILLENNPKLAHYLFNEWEVWIKKINNYRTDTSHKYIPNRIYFTSTITFSSIGNSREPQISPIKNTKIDIDIEKYVNEIHSKLSEVSSKTTQLLKWYEH